jgi:hypothetical protein
MKVALGLIHEEEAPIARATSHPLIGWCSCQRLADLSAWKHPVVVVGRAELIYDVLQSLAQGIALDEVAVNSDISRIYIPELTFGLIRLA